MSRLVSSPIDARIPELRQPAQNREVEQRLGDLERAGDFWHVVGSGAPEPAFQSTWANWGSGNAVAAFRKMGGVVWMKGLVWRPAGTAANDLIFLLPDGYKPAEHRVLGTAVGGVGGYVTITNTGEVRAGTATSSWTSLEISFAL